MKRVRILHILLLSAAVFMLPDVVYSQIQSNIAPQWINDNWRSMQYPPGEWYVGFSVGTTPAGSNVAEIRKRVEREAQNSLAQGITLNIKSETVTHTGSQRTQDKESIQRSYNQLIMASTDAEVGKVETSVYHDQANNKMYALAIVKKSELSMYYVTRIEFYLQLARNDYNLAKQLADSDRKRSALEKIAEARKNIDESSKYSGLLSAVDYKGDLSRILNSVAKLQQEIAALETVLLESAPVFITGREIMDNNSVDIIVPLLQNKFSQNGCRVTDERESAGYILTVDATNCMISKDKNFTYCYACVTTDFLNTKTQKSEAKINFTGPKAAWTTQDRACRKAFEDAVDVLWKEISTKTEVCR